MKVIDNNMEGATKKIAVDKRIKCREKMESKLERL